MRVYLVQHGEAVAEQVDPARPLTERGREDVRRIAEFLRRAGVRPDRIEHSGKLRAEQTARIIADNLLGTEAGIVVVSGLKPRDPVRPTAERLAALKGEVLLAGHQPFMGRLTSYLVTGREEPPIFAFRPGSIACIERTEDGWVLCWALRPELFPHVD